MVIIFFGATIALGNDSDILRVQTHGQSIPIAQDRNAQISSHNVIIQESMTVPPCSEVEFIGCIPVEATRKPWIVQGKQSEWCAVMVARALVEPEGNKIPMRLLNPRNVEVLITKGTVLARLESIPGSSAISAVTQQPECEHSEQHRLRLWEMV